MSDYKQFTGKNVDAAISAACKHFGVPREKLEVQIISGGSIGLFGLMGRRDAKIEARIRESFGAATATPTASSLREELLDGIAPAKADKPQAKKPAPKRQTAPKPQPEKSKKEASTPGASQPDAQAPETAAPKTPAASELAGPKDGNKSRSDNKKEKPSRRMDSQPRAGKTTAPPKTAKESDTKAPRKPKRRQDRKAHPSQRPPSRAPRKDKRTDRSPKRHVEQPAPPELTIEETAALNDEVLEVLGKLVDPIIGKPEVSVTNEPGRIKVRIEDEDNSGLIIGREGQTIAALQYLTNRIVARSTQSSVRVHLDAGSYRDKQDENLQNLAVYLADKAKKQGRIQSTKPLSSYHRRLVHLALQPDTGVTTRSKGEGALKRVLIYPNRDKSSDTE